MSVPDADTLIRLAEILEVSVSELLGTKIENENVASDVAEQLSRINEQLAIKNRRSRRIWKIVAIILAVIVLVNIFIAVFFSVPDLNSNTQNKNAENIYTLFDKSGYTITKGFDEFNMKCQQTDKMILMQKDGKDNASLPFAIDRKADDLTLSQITESAIRFLTKGEDKGFFLMVEGGKIDWACHSNDAATVFQEVIDMDNAVKLAYDFYQKHPDETLIIVTGDHETGGLTIGFAGTDYDTFLTNLENQKISYAKFDSDYVAKYKENKTSFEEVLKDVQNLFGLVTSENAAQAKDETLVLTDYEYNKLKAAYDKTMAGESEELTQEEYVLYGTYEPLTVTITHLLNNKSGVSFSSYAHTGLPVEVLAMGAGQELFEGYYDNTDIYFNLAELTGVK